MLELRHTSTLPGTTAAELWAWHAAPGAFHRLLPPWQHALVDRTDPLANGTETHFRLQLGPLRIPWVARHSEVSEGAGFVDEAVQSPFASWRHHHRFSDGPDGAVLDDHIQYTLPLGQLGACVAGGTIRSDLDQMFRWRHERTRLDLLRHRGVPPLTIAITGASGLVGTALSHFLTTGGHRVVPMVRRAAGPDEIAWDPAKGRLDPSHLEGLDAIVHLAGANVAARWTPAHKQAILDSRVQGTRLLAEALVQCERPPPVWVSCSAIGAYGHREEPVDERSPRGTGFLADVCAAWEQEAEPATQAGVRVVHPRIGIVQSARGGALAAQLPLFRAGLGGPLGSGQQGVSWIGLDDLVDVLYASIVDTRFQGIINAVAPHAVCQRDYAHTLGRVLRRPAVLPAPAFAIRAAAGEMGREMLLEGALVRPKRLEDLGFTWRHPTLEAALRAELGRALPAT